MNSPFEDLKQSWNEARQTRSSDRDGDAMLRLILKNKGAALRAHVWNAGTLAILAIGLSLFFYYLAPLQDTLSRAGIVLMIGGVLVRIGIEVASHRKARSIDFTHSSNLSAKQAKDFLSYRRRIHGPITFTIIALYTIGFYALTPEFSRHFSTFWMIMMDGSYLVAGLIPFLLVRKGVQQELQRLREIKDLLEELAGPASEQEG